MYCDGCGTHFLVAYFPILCADEGAAATGPVDYYFPYHIAVGSSFVPPSFCYQRGMGGSYRFSCYCGNI